MLLWADNSEIARLDCCMLAKKATMFSQILGQKGRQACQSHSTLTHIYTAVYKRATLGRGELSIVVMTADNTC